MSVNKVILVGRLGKNPEVRYTPSGAAVANFNIATNESWVDKSGQKQERTEWHRIVVWGKTAENCNQYLSKGRQVYVEGRLQTRQWQDKDGQTKYTTEVQAQSVEFLGGNATSSASAGSDRPSRDLGSPESAFSTAPADGGNVSYPTSSQSMGQGLGSSSSPSSMGSESSFTEDDIPF